MYTHNSKINLKLFLNIFLLLITINLLFFSCNLNDSYDSNITFRNWKKEYANYISNELTYIFINTYKLNEDTNFSLQLNRAIKNVLKSSIVRSPYRHLRKRDYYSVSYYGTSELSFLDRKYEVMLSFKVYLAKSEKVILISISSISLNGDKKEIKIDFEPKGKLLVEEINFGGKPPERAISKNSVVKIVSRLPNNSRKIGAGTVIKIKKNTGFILTAYHVVENAVEINFLFHNNSKGYQKAKIYRANKAEDIALLVSYNFPVRIPFVKITNQLDIENLEMVKAIGHPSGFSWWITEASISGFSQKKFIGFSGDAVDEGNSGGPLLDLDGRIIGVITSIRGKFGLALLVNQVIKNLEKWKYNPYVDGYLCSEGFHERDFKNGHIMVEVPKGEFIMGDNDGSDNEKPAHKVLLDDFYIDKYMVTYRQFKQFLLENPEWQKDENKSAYYLEYWKKLDYPESWDDYPVAGITWGAANAYAKWRGLRLPTEAEWEKAARGGLKGKKYPWGNEISQKLANYSRREILKVGSFPPNGYGLFDMAGNVAEWCYDTYKSNYYGKSPYFNPRGKIKKDISGFFTKKIFRVRRGGNYFNSPNELRCSARSYSSEKDSELVGFRCVR